MSTEDIKDYLKYYIGCEWQITQLGGGFASGTYKTDNYNSILLREVDMGNVIAKPILRRLSSITEEEKSKAMILNGGTIPMVNMLDNFLRLTGKQPAYTPKSTHYLLFRGFWLWDDEAFETGLIIEKK